MTTSAAVKTRRPLSVCFPKIVEILRTGGRGVLLMPELLTRRRAPYHVQRTTLEPASWKPADSGNE